MKNSKVIGMEYLHSRINLFLEEEVDIRFILSFFASHFNISEGNQFEDAISNIYFIKDECKNSSINFDEGETVYIRKSAVDFFTSPAKRIMVDEIEYIYAQKSKTIMELDKKKKTIHIYLSDGGYELEIIELIRDIVQKNEENQGVMVLHATCAYKNNNATLITGRKRAGKSTILLDLVQHLGYQFMSGDKTFVFKENDTVMVAGWPDYPHLGVGTLSKYPELIEKLNLEDEIKGIEDLWRSPKKIAVDPVLFNRVISMVPVGMVTEISNILYPEVTDAECCEVQTFHGHVSELRNNIESCYGEKKTYWNNYIIQSDGAGSKDENYFYKLKEKKGYKIQGNGFLNKSKFSEVVCEK